MDLKNTLIDYVPQFQKDSDLLKDYLDVAGEVFDELDSTIDSFKTYSDYQHIDSDKIDEFSALFDLRFFSNLDEYAKRKFAKDAAKLYTHLGTEKALKYIFKIIGIKVEVDNLWMLSPDAPPEDLLFLYNSSIFYHDTDIGQYYKEDGIISPIYPLQLIKGEATIYDNGTYVDLVSEAANSYYKKWPIYGENYGVTEETNKYYVMKTPYIKLKITEESYNLFTEDYTNPDTGEVHTYVDSEKYHLASDLMNYTLEEYIAANEVIVETALSQSFSESLTDSHILTDNLSLLINQKDLAGDFALMPYSINSEEVFGEIESTDFQSHPDSILSTEAFGDALVIWDGSMIPDSILSTEAFGINDVILVISSGEVLSGEIIDEPSVSNRINTSSIDSLVEVPTDITLSITIDSISIDSGEVIDGPTINPQFIENVDITYSGIVDEPSVMFVINGFDISSGESVSIDSSISITVDVTNSIDSGEAIPTDAILTQV